jgi:hypothetical protein
MNREPVHPPALTPQHGAPTNLDTNSFNCTIPLLIFQPLLGLIGVYSERLPIFCYFFSLSLRIAWAKALPIRLKVFTLPR